MNHAPLELVSLFLSGSNTALLVWITFFDLRQLREDFVKHLRDHVYLKDTGGGHG